MSEIIKMDDDSLLRLLSGYDDAYAEETSNKYKKDKLYSISRLLNTGLNRFAYRHLPQIAKGNIGWAIQSELALYPTAESKKKKQVLTDVSPEMMALIQDLEKRGR